jgi:peroxiredoxin
MKTRLLGAALAGIFTLGFAHAEDRATLGQAAPNFTLTGADGKTHSLADYRGKFVVLEWTNPTCPFVHKFYDSGAMQKTQADETSKGIVWLRINSTGTGIHGCQTPAEAAQYAEEKHVHATETLLDPTGEVGHLYGATNTPQMFVIDPQGKLIYAGGIDNKPSPDPADIPSATNYVVQALDEAESGQPVATPSAPPYGSAVHYSQ